VIELIDQGVLALRDDMQSLLHVAPSEIGIINRFQMREDYHPVDLFPNLYPAVATKPIDLMDMNDSERYDVVYLSHVMEHVPDDTIVFSNLHRSLKAGGQAWILVPIWDQPTKHGGLKMSAREREQHFGQWDHVRQYGADLKQKMESHGFCVDVHKAEQIDPKTFSRLGLHRDDWVFCGTKASKDHR